MGALLVSRVIFATLYMIRLNHLLIIHPLIYKGVVGIGQDITGRIAQEREYAKLIDTANAPIFVSCLWFALIFFYAVEVNLTVFHP